MIEWSGLDGVSGVGLDGVNLKSFWAVDWMEWIFMLGDWCGMVFMEGGWTPDGHGVFAGLWIDLMAFFGAS